MEISEILNALRRHKILVALVVLAAVAAAGAVKLKTKAVPTGTATVQLLVDSPQSALGNLQEDPAPLAVRASEFAQLMTSGAVLEAIAHSAGLPAAAITAEGPYSGPGSALNATTPSEARGAQIVAVKPQYRLAFVAQTNLPIITGSVQAPTAAGAGRLADAVYPGMTSWLASLQSDSNVPLSKRVTIRQLGTAQVGEINSSSSTVLAAAAGFAILMIGLLATVTLAEGRRRRQADRAAMIPPTREPLPHGVVALGKHKDGQSDELAARSQLNELVR
jgi:Chain length determinant protein